METETIASEYERRASRLAARVERLAEPYRGNAIEWLESCAARSLDDLDDGLALFLADVHPDMREITASNLEMVLDDALRHFSKQPLIG
jgi:hypothetical protein